MKQIPCASSLLLFKSGRFQTSRFGDHARTIEDGKDENVDPSQQWTSGGEKNHRRLMDPMGPMWSMVEGFTPTNGMG